MDMEGRVIEELLVRIYERESDVLSVSQGRHRDEMEFRAAALTSSRIELLGSRFRRIQSLTRFHQPLHARHFIIDQRTEQFLALLILLNLGNRVGERLQHHSRVATDA